jgi:hypothetical protein
MRKQYFIEKNELKTIEIINKLTNDMFRRDLVRAHKSTDRSNGKEMVE